MGGFLEVTGSIGATVLLMPLYISAVLGPAALAFWLLPGPPVRLAGGSRGERLKLNALRWTVGLLAAGAWFFFVYPSVEAVERVSCRIADDFKLCMEGE